MVTAKLARWHTLFEQMQAHKQLLREALDRHSLEQAPYPEQLKAELEQLEREAMRALAEAAQALEAHHASTASHAMHDQLPERR